ncbi:MAG: tRNA dihydrouridine synthase DusB [Candidatus Sumerlaeaceae bacterium]|nr:tRNA dihydrouridine synthase DusB [Candidatus Sumerlaeaceae bacterium]
MKPLCIGGVELRSRVIPAPMCNVSDRAYRGLARRMGADLVFTQMISSEGLTRNDEGTRRILDIEGEEPPVAVQMLGSNPQVLAKAAQILEAEGAAIIDLNMGCPARKVTGNDCGSALMRNPTLVAEIVRTISKAIKVPFTVKMRAGWNDKDISAIELARICEGEGAQAVSLHGRTREQGYKGEADWSLIARMKETLTVPVIGNGDVTSPADAVRMIRETGCDGVMIGRGLIGNPWLQRACEAAMQDYQEGRIADESAVPGDDLVEIENDDGLATIRVPYYMREVSIDERLNLIIEHTKMMVESKGEHRGVMEMRKHSQQYIKGIPGGKTLRQKLMKVEKFEDIGALLAEYRDYLAQRGAQQRAHSLEMERLTAAGE